ncbi:hypothetical protein [uncultured Enterovirga sp.]|uniref:hypothetical protein n=1 Tax=uncultured Enterovirga sp. TaxID=2026352 RepID=UPI0035CA85C5
MSDNLNFVLSAVAVSARAGALSWASPSGRGFPSSRVNAASATAFLGYGISRVPYLLTPPDLPWLALLAIESLLLLLTLSTARANPTAFWFNGAAFTAHSALSATALVFCSDFSV